MEQNKVETFLKLTVQSVIYQNVENLQVNDN